MGTCMYHSESIEFEFYATLAEIYILFRLVKLYRLYMYKYFIYICVYIYVIFILVLNINISYIYLGYGLQNTIQHNHFKNLTDTEVEKICTWVTMIKKQRNYITSISIKSMIIHILWLCVLWHYLIKSDLIIRLKKNKQSIDT